MLSLEAFLGQSYKKALGETIDYDKRLVTRAERALTDPTDRHQALRAQRYRGIGEMRDEAWEWEGTLQSLRVARRRCRIAG